MNDKFNEIDKKLSILMEKLEYNNYLDIIKNNFRLKKYDFILGRIDIGKLPEFCIKLITKKDIELINKYLDNKIKEI